jgi:hypothetical protein
MAGVEFSFCGADDANEARLSAQAAMLQKEFW